ncbi:MAG: hypothetical protein JSS30_05075 [Verrucomicrobia bacterium]|nr:hypothetical protein [Verrucomicrobiota bacterium]
MMQKNNSFFFASLHLGVKRTLSLIEVMLGLLLATILITTLFSSFRELMLTHTKLAKMHQEKHWEYVLNVRLNQIFEAIRSDALFTTEPYRDITPSALHFFFNNGIDSEPKFCQELEGYLFQNKEKELCLVLQSKDGSERKEVFVKNGKDYKLEFFDPLTKKWTTDWSQTLLPPIVQLNICGKTFRFVLPHGNRMVQY